MINKFTYVSFAYIKFTYDEVCLQTLFSYHFHVVTHFTMFDLTRCVNKRGSISVFVQFSRLQVPKLFYKGNRVPNTMTVRMMNWDGSPQKYRKSVSEIKFMLFCIFRGVFFLLQKGLCIFM